MTQRPPQQRHSIDSDESQHAAQQDKREKNQESKAPIALTAPRPSSI